MRKVTQLVLIVAGASSLAAGHLTLIPELKDELKRLGRDDILIVHVRDAIDLEVLDAELMNLHGWYRSTT